MARLSMLSAMDIPQPPQFVLPGRSRGSERSAFVWATPPRIGSLMVAPPSLAGFQEHGLPGRFAAEEVLDDAVDVPRADVAAAHSHHVALHHGAGGPQPADLAP